MKKQIYWVSLSLLIAAFCLGVASAQASSTSDEGVVHDDVSKRFTITTYPARLVLSEGDPCIRYRLAVDNQNNEAYKNVVVTFSMNKALDEYIAAGVFPFPFTKVDLAAKNAARLADDEGRGIELHFEQLLSDEQFMREAKLNYESILTLGQTFDVTVAWDGGSETYALTAPVVDEAGLMGND